MEKKYYQITVVGAPRADDKTKIKYARDANLPAGFTFTGAAKDKRSFFHLELAELTATTVTINGKQMTIPNPQVKPFTFNCFERSHPELYRAVLREIKSNKEDNITFEKDLGDKSGLRIILLNLAVPGAIAAFKLPYEVYRMNRDPKTHKLVQYKTQSYGDDGSIQTVPVTTITGETFLYGNECDAHEVFIDRAIKAVLKVSKEVKAQTTFENTGSAPENTSVTDEPEKETPESPEKEDEADV